MLNSQYVVSRIYCEHKCCRSLIRQSIAKRERETEKEREKERFQSKLLRRSETRVEIRLPFDFRSTATFVSFRFLCTEFLWPRAAFLISCTTCTRHVSSARRDPALVGPAGDRSEIDYVAAQVPVPDFRLSLLRRPESDSRDRYRWPGLH